MASADSTIAKEGYAHNPEVNGAGNVPVTGGALMTGLYPKTEFRKFANPAPLGLCGFALTTFILSMVNVQSRGVSVPSVVIGSAYAYGGLVQLLAGMWEMAVGNTFGATALSSYGGFWISFAIIITGGAQDYGIISSYDPTASAAANKELSSALGFFLCGWWIFTTLMLIATLRTTVAFFMLFFTLDLAFLMLFIAKFVTDDLGNASVNITKAGGVFGLMAAFLAWYCALAGVLDDKNSWFLVPVIHLPWSPTAMERRQKQHAV